jgi:arginyl-tRNA synthetase
MNLFADFQTHIAKILNGLIAEGRLPRDLDLSRFVVEPPRDASHGDVSTNAAMVYAKEAKESFGNPRQFAAHISEHLAQIEGVAAVEIAGPGFLNIRLQPVVFETILRHSLSTDDYGRGNPARLASKGAINIEYVSANPTGPMHVGHGRGAVFGDALASLLDFAGAKVTREYYINDAGAQVDVLARSAFMRYREALGEVIDEIPEGLYPGDYLKPVGQALAQKHGRTLLDQPESQWLELVRLEAIDAMMAMIRTDLAALNIRHDVFYSERSLTRGEAGDVIGAVIADLRSRGIVYEGRLPPPKGQPVEDWEDREQTLFRSTDFGDDIDRPLMKSDGSYTYFAADIAYHKSKVDRGFKTLIDVWGADHGGYVKRMQAAVAAVSQAKSELDVKLCQLVKLMRQGEPVKMSKRSGDFITLRDVVDEVGVDAVRFMMLFRKNDAPLEFDLAKVIEQSRDNPVFYVQYAHARCQSVLRLAHTTFADLNLDPAHLAHAQLDLLADEGEQALVKLIAQYPRQIEAAAQAHEPHRVAFYLHELASSLHSHWNRGKDQPQLRFVNEESRDLTSARLALVTSLARVLASGLQILGVSAPIEMR